jgi:hypothetical protein
MTEELSPKDRTLNELVEIKNELSDFVGDEKNLTIEGLERYLRLKITEIEKFLNVMLTHSDDPDYLKFLLKTIPILFESEK